MEQPRASTVIHGIGTLVTPARVPAPVRGADLGRVVELSGAAIAVGAAGSIIAVGPEREVRDAVTTDDDTRFHDARGMLAIPGFVDCHTHPVFAGDRAAEFELRNQGAGYEEIHAAGGGIRASVAKTRAALDDGSIAPQVRRHLDWMLAAGTTTAEGKSGYALTIEHELESLRMLAAVAADHPVQVVGTLLAAHTVPVEFDGDPDGYVDEVAIPAVRAAAREGLARAADVFLERGSFDRAQAQRYLQAARDAGLDARMHGDQFSDQGGIELALEVGARSIDHLEALSADDARLGVLAQSNVAGVLLPLSSLFLGRPYAPGRALVDAGAIIALASDFNPGSSYGESIPMSMTLACLGCRLTAAEALTAATVNAAWVLGLHERVGRLDVGYRADVLLLDQPALAHLPYHVGTPGLRDVFVGGRLVEHAQGVPA
ncbi:MAG: imidazolonepropionase [Thermoleophilia bacterium]|nr:imidazolonepropionase [Thermoleophilia bacterium]